MDDRMLFAALGLISVIAGGAFWYLRRRFGAERKLKELLSRVGDDHLRDIVIPDGVGGEIQIDCLLRTAYGLIALDINTTQGAMFAGDRLETWSATHNGQRVTFDNPIPQLLARLDALQLLVGDVPLEGRILFVGEVEFPKGHPPQVATLESLLAEFENATRDSTAIDLEDHWRRIHSAILSVGN